MFSTSICQNMGVKFVSKSLSKVSRPKLGHPQTLHRNFFSNFCGISLTTRQHHDVHKHAIDAQMLERPSRALRNVRSSANPSRSRFNASRIDVDGGQLSYFLLFFEAIIDTKIAILYLHPEF